MTIIYKNTNDDFLTEDQIKNVDYYYKEYYENNVLKKAETFHEKVLVFVKYMLNDNDSPEIILSSYPKSIKISFFKEVLKTPYYTEFSLDNYKSGVLFSQSIFIENGYDEIIFDKTINYTNKIILNFEKYYYQNGNLVYIFEYYDTGKVYFITSYKDNGPCEIRHDSDYFKDFNWDGLEYYLDGNIIFP